MRRGLSLTAAMIVLLPIVTFAMAYFIVDIPKPGRHPDQPGLDDPGQRRLGDRQNRSARR